MKPGFVTDTSEINITATFLGDDNMTDVVGDGGDGGPAPREMSGIMFFVILVFVFYLYWLVVRHVIQRHWIILMHKGSFCMWNQTSSRSVNHKNSKLVELCNFDDNDNNNNNTLFIQYLKLKVFILIMRFAH